MFSRRPHDHPEPELHDVASTAHRGVGARLPVGAFEIAAEAVAELPRIETQHEAQHWVDPPHVYPLRGTSPFNQAWCSNAASRSASAAAAARPNFVSR